MNSFDLQLEMSSWIIDTRDLNHMCHALNMFNEVTNINPPLPVYLPDGSTHLVHKMGRVILSKAICLINVMYLPNFNFNLLSVHALCASTNLSLSIHALYASTNLSFHPSSFSLFFAGPED